MTPVNLPLLSTEPLRLDLPDADVRLWRQAFQPAAGDEMHALLRSRFDWQQEDIMIFGECRRLPRLVP